MFGGGVTLFQTFPGVAHLNVIIAQNCPLLDPLLSAKGG